MHKHYKDILSNGLTVSTVEMPHLHTADVVLYLRCGSRFENIKNNGISHFLEHTILKGCREFPSSRELHEVFENIGGDLNGATSGEYLYLSYNHHPDFFKEGIRVFADLVKNPVFNEFEVEKKVVLEEILAEKNTNGDIVDIDSVACKALWPDNGLGLGTLGSSENVMSFTVEDVRRHYDEFFTAPNMLLCCSGKVERKRVVESAKAFFGDLKGGRRKEIDTVEYVQKERQIVFLDNPEPKADVQICFRGYSYNSPFFFPMLMLRRILSDGVGSRLNYSIREEKGLVYDIMASVSPFYDTGSFDIDFSVANHNIEETISSVLDEIIKLLREGIVPNELELAKRRHIFGLDYSVDSPFKMCSRFGWGELFSKPLTHAEERELVEKISSEDVLEVLERLFTKENLNLIVIGSISEASRKRVNGIVDSFCQVA